MRFTPALLTRAAARQAPRLVLVAAVVLAACTPASTPAAPIQATVAPTNAPPTTVPAATAASAASIELVSNESLGEILADGNGRTLYLFLNDTPGTSNCYDKCAQAWPPLLTTGTPSLAAGLDAAVTGTTTRTDGTTQVTYNDWPLYYFAKDQAAGDTNGQSVGDVWWVVSAAGEAVRPAALQVAQGAALGSFLVDSAGNTLYLFLKDTDGTSVCYDDCEKAWPPLLTTGTPTLGDGLDATLIGTTPRTDGTTQVTYNGAPLYYFAGDAAAGDTKGQGLGDVWYVVAPNGAAVTATAG